MKISNSKKLTLSGFALLAFNASAQIQMATKPYEPASNVPEIGFSFDAPPAAQPLAPPEIWAIKRSSSLHQTLGHWSDRAGWTLVWGLGENEDMRVEACNNFQGNFQTAVTDLFNSFPASVRINAELRPDNTPPLIFINREDGAR